MTNQDNRPKDATDLRQKAESLARERAARTPEDSAALSPEEIRKTLHELRVHQIELEMQNEELRTAQARIEAGRARYFDLYDLAPVGYCTLSEQGLILEANLTAATLLGTSRGALIRQPISRFILKEDQEIYYLHRKKLFETHSTGSGQAGEPQECELRLVKPDGALFWAHLRGTVAQGEDGGPVCLVAISDITDRKRTEEALREKAFLMDSSSAIIGTCDLDGRMTYANPAFLRGLGYDMLEEILERQLGEFWLVQDRLDEIMGALMNDGGPGRWAGELQVRRKDGSLFEVYASAVTVPDRSGKPMALMSTSIDITERKQAEAEREKLQSQLTQAQKMESVGRLAGGVAHDFNNKLTVMMGYTQLVMRGLDRGDPIAANLQEVMNAGQQSVAIVRQLLAFARKQIISPRVLNLNETMEDMLKMLRRFIGEDIALVWSPGHDLWQVKMDPSQLDQILANLCVNARDAIEGAGKVTIETQNKMLGRSYCDDHPGCSPGEYVMLAVTDNGCGMDIETLANAFEPFFTTKEVGKGTGLGLSTVYGIVKQNQGHIDVVSEPGKGASFKICLPRHLGEAEEGIEAAQTEALRGRGETILVVEDDPGVLQLGKRILERLGYAVLTSASPAEAVNLAREYAGQIHLLMTDVVLPEMSGRDLAGEISKIRPNIKTMFMSGYTAEVIARHGVLEEGIHFIGKPFTPDSLGRKVREALGSEE